MFYYVTPQSFLMHFSELGLSEKTLAALTKLKYTSATEIQAKSIPQITAGNNVLLRSQTGTGKTAAFGIGIIERIAKGSSKHALILAPTRELALQVGNEINILGEFHRFKVRVAYGGQNLERQISELRGGVDILIATPGRLLDLARRGAVNLHQFDLAILDEADLMLDMGFIDEVSEVMDQLPTHYICVLVSATLEPGIMQMASKYVKNPAVIEVGDLVVASTVKEEYVEVTDRGKFHRLVEVLRAHIGMKILIFRETKMASQRLHERLSMARFRTGVLQGDMSQSQRNAVLSAFKEGAINVLVATNVAARGLHIENLGLIINYDEAKSGDVHLHRVGRTGRMGTEGKAITFIRKRESLDERMSEDHPDFAWMRQGSYESSGPRRRPPLHPDRSGPSRTGPHERSGSARPFSGPGRSRKRRPHY